MKKQIFKILIFFTTLVLCSCNNGNNSSLQEYCFSKEADPNFIVLNISGKIISLVPNVPEEIAKDVLQRLKRVKIFVFKPLASLTKEAIEKEQKTAKKILKDTDYEQLIKVKGKFGLLRIWYKGDIEKKRMDEILVYSKMYHQESSGIGFILVRAIADDFPLDKMSLLVKYIKSIDTNQEELRDLIEMGL